MKKALIIIAGPMVSGKTTAAKILKQAFKKTAYHPEINQYTLLGSSHPGGAFVDAKLEERIIKTDLSRLEKIIEGKQNLIHLVETDVFHCVYLRILGEGERAGLFEGKYQRLHQRIKVGVLYLDTRPKVSWARRRGYYLKRALKEIKEKDLEGAEAKKLQDQMMRKYRERIFALYPIWRKMFEALSYPKIKIPNNGKSLVVFKKKVVGGFLKLAEKMKISPQLIGSS